MPISMIRAAITLCTVSTMVDAQLYLMTGTPTAQYDSYFPSILFQVSGDGVRQVAEIVPQRVGTEWTAISYEWKKALILPSQDNRVHVLDLNQPAVAKTCVLPVVPNMSLIEKWLADVPGRGPTFEWFVAGDGPNEWRLQGMLMDPAVSCEETS